MRMRTPWTALAMAAALAAAATDALAGDVTVERKGKTVVVRGSDGDDEISVSYGSTRLIVQAAAGTSVNGSAGPFGNVVVGLLAGDRISVDLGNGLDRVVVPQAVKAPLGIVGGDGTLEVVVEDIDAPMTVTSGVGALVLRSDPAGNVGNMLSAAIRKPLRVRHLSSAPSTVELIGTLIDAPVAIEAKRGSLLVQMKAVDVNAAVQVRAAGVVEFMVTGGVFESAPLSVVGKRGSDQVVLAETGFDLKSPVKIDLGEGDDGLVLDDCEFDGKVGVKLKGGADLASLLAVTFRSKTTLDCGNDADEAALRQIRTAGGPGAVVKLGSGDDAVSGLDTTTLVDPGRLTVDGGKGTDSSDSIVAGVQPSDGTIVLKSIE